MFHIIPKQPTVGTQMIKRTGFQGASDLRMIFLSVIFFFTIVSCDKDTPPSAGYPNINRHELLPGDISKQGPGTDQHPPILYSAEYNQPVPLDSGVNTSGAEDSPFILPDGNTLYFFFTPDVRIQPEKQLLDDVTGVWVSQKVNNEWAEAQRIWLQEPGKPALDGAVAVQGDEMWFASVREGFVGVNMFTAQKINNKWSNWQYSGDRLMKEIKIGEVHIHGNDLYFHSDRSGGLGNFDIWVTTRNGNDWTDAVHVSAVNTSEMDGYPFISTDGDELWFCRTYSGTPAIFRSMKQNEEWSEPELIISQFAGEPTLDNEGNLYFVHHYYENNVMIEADIYVAYKKK